VIWRAECLAVARAGGNLGPFRVGLAGMAERRECCDENRVKNVANERDGRTMVLFSRAKGKLRLNTSRGGIQLSPRALSGLWHFPVGMMRAEVAPGCGKRPFIRRIQT